MLESPKSRSRDTSVDASPRNKSASSAELLGEPASETRSIEKRPSTEFLGMSTSDIPAIIKRSATGLSGGSASETRSIEKRPSNEILSDNASETRSIEKRPSTELLSGNASETRSISRKTSQLLRERLSFHRRSRSDNSDTGTPASVYLTPQESPSQEKGPASDSPHSSRNQSRNRSGNISPWHPGDITLEGFSFREVSTLDLDEQKKSYKKLIPQVDALKPQGDTKRSARRKERVWDTGEVFKGNLDSNLSSDISKKKFKVLLTQLEAHANSSAKATDGSYNYLWSSLTRLTQFIRSTEKTGKAPIEALSKELVAFNSAATNRVERLKAMQRSAGTNAARTVEWASTIHEAIRLVEGANHDYKWGGNFVDEAATRQLTKVSNVLERLEVPKILKFADIAEVSLAPASIGQILLEKPMIRRNIPTPDSVQEEIHQTLKLENATGMQTAVEKNITDLQLPANQGRDKKKLVEVTTLMSQLAHEPIKHAENLEILKNLENFSNPGKPLDHVRREADERKSELEIKVKGKNLISDMCDKVWKSGHPSVEGIRYNNDVIMKQIALAEKANEAGEAFNPEKLHDAIERHAAHSKDFVDAVARYADAYQESFLEEKAGEIASKKSGLFHEEFKASYGAGNLAQKITTILGQSLLSKAVSSIP